ncbi:MAG: FHA domain-containing protein [Gemmataceae bacterium]
MRAQLVPEGNGKPIEITKDMTLVGRGDMCDMRIEHKSVSKMHCVIVRTDGLLLLRDLGSTNGTRVNGTRVRRAALLPDDELSIASLKYRILFGEKLLANMLPEEKTQHIVEADLKKLIEAKKAEVDSSVQPDESPVQANSLPDVYPEDSEKNT